MLNAILVHRDVHKNIIIKLLYFDSPFRRLRGSDVKAIEIHENAVMCATRRFQGETGQIGVTLSIYDYVASLNITCVLCFCLPSCIIAFRSGLLLDTFVLSLC